MPPQIDPLRDVKRMMTDVESKFPAGVPKISTFLPAAMPSLPGGGSAEMKPEEILREPARVFRRIEGMLPTGAPKISEMVGKPPMLGEEEREPKITGGGREVLPADRGPKIIG